MHIFVEAKNLAWTFAVIVLGFGQKKTKKHSISSPLRLLMYISSLNWIHVGGTESSEIRHITKINIQKKENQLIGRKIKEKSMRDYPNIFLLCSFQVCGGFITTTWDSYSPKETGQFCPRASVKKTLLMALEVTTRSTQADMLMRGWCHDQGLMWWCQGIY